MWRRSSGTTILQLHDLQGNIIATVGTSEAETKLLTTYNSTEFGVPGEGKTPPKYAWLGATGVTTELAAGVATKGGASYVPQNRTQLQTAPVVPPGAFPNGQGSGSPYISAVSGWSGALSQAQSAEVIAEEFAKQEAARREACEADPLSCIVVGGDPAPWVYHFWSDEARDVALNIREWIREGKEAAIIGFFFGSTGFAEETAEFIFRGTPIRSGMNTSLESWNTAYVNCSFGVRREKEVVAYSRRPSRLARFVCRRGQKVRSVDRF
jgi:hypothetical protein